MSSAQDGRKGGYPGPKDPAAPQVVTLDPNSPLAMMQKLAFGGAGAVPSQDGAQGTSSKAPVQPEGGAPLAGASSGKGKSAASEGSAGSPDRSPMAATSTSTFSKKPPDEAEDELDIPESAEAMAEQNRKASEFDGRKKDRRYDRSDSGASDQESQGAGGELFCTMMIKNIPHTYTEEAMLAELQIFVDKSRFDFFYMPWDTKTDANCGCAFINFVTPVDALQCINALSGNKFRFVRSDNICEVVPAHVQGLAENLVHHHRQAASSSGKSGSKAHKPIVQRNGVEMDLDEAIEQFCDPRAKARLKSQLSLESLDSGASKQGEDVESPDGGGSGDDDGCSDYSDSQASSRSRSKASEESGSYDSSQSGLSQLDPEMIQNFAERFG